MTHSSIGEQAAGEKSARLDSEKREIESKLYNKQAQQYKATRSLDPQYLPSKRKFSVVKFYQDAMQLANRTLLF